MNHDLGRLLLAERDVHRAIGRCLDAEPQRLEVMRDFAFAWQANSLALPPGRNHHPFRLPNGRELYGLSARERAMFYEALGYLDPSLMFAMPGPEMAGFVVDGLGDDAIRNHFNAFFERDLCWTFFAMSERSVGSDAWQLKTWAHKTNGGYLLHGEKFFIGNGGLASLGVVFARTGDGPLGLEVFLVEPRNLPGFSAEPLTTTGCPGSNLAHLKFADVFVPNHYRLGAHLKPTERLARSALRTFDALRPCIGAAALGVARSLIDRAEATFRCDARWLREARVRLDGARGLLWQCCDGLEPDRRTGPRIGLMKAHAVALAETLALELLHRLPPAAMVEHDWLGKGWRDLKAFEYTEGTRFIHWQNAATTFQRRSCNAP